MAVPANPFAVLSYVGGPALLTNSAALLLLSTSNRFGRAIDRSRELVVYLDAADGVRDKTAAARELKTAQRRVQLIGHAMSRYYLSTGMFAMATMISIAGAVSGDIVGGLAFEAIIAVAAISGIMGFVALVSGSAALTLESRIAVRALKNEALEAVEAIDRVLHPSRAR